MNYNTQKEPKTPLDWFCYAVIVAAVLLVVFNLLIFFS